MLFLGLSSADRTTTVTVATRTITVTTRTTIAATVAALTTISTTVTVSTSSTTGTGSASTTSTATVTVSTSSTTGTGSASTTSTATTTAGSTTAAAFRQNHVTFKQWIFNIGDCRCLIPAAVVWQQVRRTCAPGWKSNEQHTQNTYQFFQKFFPHSILLYPF
jgi:hypothetical protein